ncbi:MAG: CsgG/HfaB family protein, partial [Cyanobacteriota bacterium]
MGVRKKEIMLKKSIISLLFLLGLSFPAFAEKKIAVLPFDVPSDKLELKQFGTGTSDTITMALTNIKEFIMIDRSRTENILKEQAFQKSGFVEQENAIKLGKLLGAEILVAGSIQYSAGNYRLTARLTDVETGKVLKSVQVTGNDIFDLQDKIAIEIIKANNIKIENNTNNQPITNNDNNSFTIATKTESISLFER